MKDVDIASNISDGALSVSTPSIFLRFFGRRRIIDMIFYGKYSPLSKKEWLDLFSFVLPPLSFSAALPSPVKAGVSETSCTPLSLFRVGSIFRRKTQRMTVGGLTYLFLARNKFSVKGIQIYNIFCRVLEL